MAAEKVKVLYIAGMGRSGSTILGNILGSIEGFFHVGELHSIWRLNLSENRLCGCGTSFRECDVWRSILGKAFGGIDQVDSSKMLDTLRRQLRTRRTLPLSFRHQGKAILKSRLGSYLDNLERLYHAVQSVTGSQVIVDSSKSPSYGYALSLIPTIDLYVIHLIRDPRAVAYSFTRKKFDPDGMQQMRVQPAVKTAGFWLLWNLATERLLRYPERYVRVNYEDFIARPVAITDHIVQFVKAGSRHLPFVEDHTVEIKPNHSICGNPERFKTGKVELRLDTEWKSRLEMQDKALVTLLTWPLLLWYDFRRQSKVYKERTLDECGPHCGW
jgi:hypothetical protein